MKQEIHYQVRSHEYLQELRNIAGRKRGKLYPEDVVRAARREDSPLHTAFEWDDSEAARKYRLVQARMLINVSYERLPESGKLRKVFVSLKSERFNHDEGGYRQVIDVMQNRELRNELLQDSLEDLERFRLRYHSIKELTEVMQAADRTLDTHKTTKNGFKTLLTKGSK